MKYQKFTLKSKNDLDALMNRIGDARFVLLGESSHGTHEFYSWRAAISKRLIEEKGFNFISVEGDWPDCYKINRFIKGYETEKNAQSILSTFVRWPTWMWGNWEIVSLANWMKEYNDRLPDNSRKVGFYGLDVYSLWESLDVIQKYLNENDPQTAKICKKAVDCFSSYNRDEHAYAMRSLSSPCRDEVTRLLSEVRKKSPQYQYDPEDSLNMEQNSWVAVEAEKYYRNMVSFDDQTWNIRDKHMMDTLKRLVQFHGPESKAIVWEHNTHIGDARYTIWLKQECLILDNFVGKIMGKSRLL
jgi:erythromycin esterase-like protein